MREASPRLTAIMVAAAVAAAVAAGCRATRPAGAPAAGAPPAATRPAATTAPGSTPAAAPAAARARASDADVRFVRRMIPHHAQALAMTDLVPARSAREDVRRIAERIAISQRDEIALMRRWLQARGVPAPGGEHAGHVNHGDHGDHGAMPGMLTPDELARLGSATGPAFDRLFLEQMIRHHEGALAMVAELFAAPGAGQDPEVFRLASDVDADQRAEIARLRALLRAGAPAGAPRPGAPRR